LAATCRIMNVSVPIVGFVDEILHPIEIKFENLTLLNIATCRDDIAALHRYSAATFTLSLVPIFDGSDMLIVGKNALSNTKWIFFEHDAISAISIGSSFIARIKELYQHRSRVPRLD